MFLHESACKVVFARVATKQRSPAGWRDMEEVEERGEVWQFSVRGGNGMVLLKLVIRLLWHPACMEDVRGSPPGGEEVHRSGSVIFSVSATLSLVHCQSGHGRYISTTLLFSLPKCPNICRKMHKPVEFRAADAEFVWSVLAFDERIRPLMTISDNQTASGLGKRPPTTSACGCCCTLCFLIKLFHRNNQKCHWHMTKTHSVIMQKRLYIWPKQ